MQSRCKTMTFSVASVVMLMLGGSRLVFVRHTSEPATRGRVKVLNQWWAFLLLLVCCRGAATAYKVLPLYNPHARGITRASTGFALLHCSDFERGLTRFSGPVYNAHSRGLTRVLALPWGTQTSQFNLLVGNSHFTVFWRTSKFQPILDAGNSKFNLILGLNFKPHPGAMKCGNYSGELKLQPLSWGSETSKFLREGGGLKLNFNLRCSNSNLILRLQHCPGG